MLEQKKFTKPEAEIIKFSEDGIYTDDILATSGEQLGNTIPVEDIWFTNLSIGKKMPMQEL